MPSAYVKRLAKDTGKSEKEIEKLWDKAKGITSETFDIKQDDFTSKEFSYTVGIVKNMLKSEESFTDPSYFLDSDMGARDFLEETVSSSQFNIGTVKPPKKKSEEDEDEEEDEEPIEKEMKKEKAIDPSKPVVTADEIKRLFKTNTEFTEDDRAVTEALDLMIKNK